MRQRDSNGNVETKRTAEINIDPRISSPSIKVVYPSLRANQPTVAQPEVILPRTPQSANLTDSSKPSTFESTPQETASQVGTTQTGSTPDTEEPQEAKKQSWIEAIKEHTALIVVVALAGFALGFLIAKNK